MNSLVRVALALLVLAGLNSCGSGAVSGPPPVSDPTKITILPATALAYSGLPTVFTVTGGTGAYIVSSSNQAIIPISGPISGTSFTVVPNPVLANTDVTLSVRDTGTAPVVSATVTVQPGTVNNDITVTSTSTFGSACTPAICSGADALVTVTISQGGIPLAARGVRFSVVSGTYSFVTTTNNIDSLTSTVDIVTDETGKAVARIRIPPNAANQSAILQVTDLGTGTFQRASFAISQSTGSVPGFSVLPSAVAFQGAFTTQCAGVDGNEGAVFTVVGGVPPYTVSPAGSAFSVLPLQITASGGTFTVKPNGTCVPTPPGQAIVVVDSSGHTATATVSNVVGTASAPIVTVSPATVTLTSCTSSASVNIAGGVTNVYFVSNGSDALTTNAGGSVLTVSRRDNSAPVAGPLSIGVSDGQTVATVTVNLVGAATGACSSTIHTTPSVVTLTDCGTSQTVTLTGTPGTYMLVSDNAAVSVSATSVNVPLPGTFTVQRVPGSGTFTPPSTVTITGPSGTNPTQLLVNASTAGSATCP